MSKEIIIFIAIYAKEEDKSKLFVSKKSEHDEGNMSAVMSS